MDCEACETTGVDSEGSPWLTRWMLLGVVAVVLLMTGVLHSGVLHDVVMWDEADYAYAASRGVIANALNQGELNRVVRHHHAPLSIYAIWLSTSLFGLSTWAVRLPGIAMGVLSSGLAVLVGYDLAVGSRRMKWVVGVMAGLLMTTAPASILMTTTARPHPFVAFFLLLNMWSLCRYFLRPTTRRAAIFGLTLAGQFVSMEYGPVVVFLSVVAIALVSPRRLGLRGHWPFLRRSRFLPFIRVHRHVWTTLGSCLGAIALIWPAGLYRLSVLLNSAFFMHYAGVGHRTLFRGQIYQNVPKYAYAWWYAVEYPVLLAVMLLVVVLIVVWAIRTRRAVAVTLAVFTLGLGAAVHGAHIMELSYSLFMIPPLVLGGPLAGAWLVRSLSAWQVGNRRAGFSGVFVWKPLPGLAGTLLMALGFAAVLGGRIQPAESNDLKNTQLVKIVYELDRMVQPGERVLAQAWPIVRYELLKMGHDDVVVYPYDPSNYASDRLGDRFDAGRFDWVVTAGSTVAAYPDCPLLSQLHRQWIVVAEEGGPPQEYRLYAPPAMAGVSRWGDRAIRGRRASRVEGR